MIGPGESSEGLRHESARCHLRPVRSENQREASIEDQLRICRARAAREGWTVVGEFSDAAISGTKEKRPGFVALRDAARAGKCDVILAESLDRFSRDLEHVAAFYKQVTFCRVKLVTLAEGEISDFHVGVKGAMGALYLKDLAAKTHRGLEGRLRKGHCITTPAYGYRVVRRTGASSGRALRSRCCAGPSPARAC
ncbi:recombinase family protein [Roseomonas sp. PWR1]|uniref:Recombinase family protein n=1 Tax=Roseomonas nitratireducens TaxID=2820810 RepID=A0ABS4AS82_9PROT|nr:recombinase family protein [Neoroseomonas nitratireducens]MBP0464208.1 recombinase family protein [Neoroseomonas nitratireducens]